MGQRQEAERERLLLMKGEEITEHSCRQWETGHYVEKGKFINGERFQSTPLPQLTGAKSFLHLQPWAKGESDEVGRAVVNACLRLHAKMMMEVHSCRAQ